MILSPARWPIWLLLGALCGCNSGPKLVPVGQGIGPTSVVTFTRVQADIFNSRCVSCHSNQLAKGGLSLEDYSATLSSPGAVVPYQPYQSEVYKRTYNGQMPKDGPPLTTTQLQELYNWIALGGENN